MQRSCQRISFGTVHRGPPILRNSCVRKPQLYHFGVRSSGSGFTVLTAFRRVLERYANIYYARIFRISGDCEELRRD